MIRPATHAGSWYDKNPIILRQQIDNWLQNLKIERKKTKKGNNYAVAPHAGYRFCGPILAHTYSQIDPSVERVVLMGPSHFQYFRGIKTTSYHELETPLGNLKVDQDAIAQLSSICKLSSLESVIDLKEHSWEMHLPFIARVAPKAKVLPLLFGSFDDSETKKMITELSALAQNSRTVFVVSSDFCHWGTYFDYTPFKTHALLIYKFIDRLDHEGIALLTSGSTSTDWEKYITQTGNTVCGNIPIKVLLMISEFRHDNVKFDELAYSQSSTVHSIKDSSVSYAALIG